MEPERKERRDGTRVAVAGVKGTLRAPLDVTVRDLSPQGAGVETSCWLSVGRSYRVKLVRDDQEVSFSGTVAWCALAGTAKGAAGGDRRPIYRAGILFGQLLDGNAKTFNAFVKAATSGKGKKAGARIDASISGTAFWANDATRVFHLPDCRHIASSSRQFATREAALAAGFRPGGCCGP